MAITVKYLEGLGVDKETAEKIFAERGAEIEKEKAKAEKIFAERGAEIEKEKAKAEKIFAERGAEIEKEKAKAEKLENELKESKENFDKLTSELETLKADNANGEEWKAKFEKLQSDIEAEKKQAEYDRIMKEKNESIEKRFNAVVGDRKFNHDAIRAEYLKKFGEALENKDFEGKGDSDIFHELTKDDGNAFEGIKVFKLPGGTSRATGKTYNNKEEIMAIKDRAERRQAIAENPSLFGLTNKGD